MKELVTVYKNVDVEVEYYQDTREVALVTIKSKDKNLTIIRD